ncbi:hypothetical protein PIROE2DRAFT_22114, partial [Piromyces sp. E2]
WYKNWKTHHHGYLYQPKTIRHNKVILILDTHAIGYEGFQKTYERLKRTCYWKGMTTDIKRVIKACSICQMNK